MINKQVEACLNILENLEGFPKLRVKQLYSYIEELEKEVYELSCFFTKVSKAVREHTDGEDDDN